MTSPWPVTRLDPFDGTDCAGVVLAGGHSSRMGHDKAALAIDGEPLLRRVVRRLRAALPQVVVVGPDHLGALVPETRVVPDREASLGPLSGLLTALRVVAAPRVFVVACDMPFVAPDLVRAMARLAAEPPPVDAVLLRSGPPSGPGSGAPPGAQVEYLHAVYAQTCLPVVEHALATDDRSLRHLVSLLAVRELPHDVAARHDSRGLSAFNANTPAEWERALALAADEALRLGEEHERDRAAQQPT